MKDNNSIGDRLTKERHKLKISKKEFAEKIGIAASQVSDVEHGVSLLSVDSLNKISKAVNAPIDVFLTGYDKRFIVYAIDDYCQRVEKDDVLKVINSILELYR